MTRNTKKAFEANQALAYTDVVRYTPDANSFPDEPNIFVVTKTSANFNGTPNNMKVQISLNGVDWSDGYLNLALTAGQMSFQSKAVGPISVPVYARVAVPTFTVGTLEIELVI